mgnify:CR=1 FL=1
MILQVVESPLITPHSHEPSNGAKFDFVFTYAHQPTCDSRYYCYRIPNCQDFEEADIPFSERRCIVMVNSNKVEGWFGSSRVGTRKFARAAEKKPNSVLDVYGAGWRGETITWLPIARPKEYRCAEEDVLVDREAVAEYRQKIPLIANYRFGVATENYRGTKGYISEKLIDVMLAGTVPIYLGEESVDEVIPSGSFVDARKFGSHEAILGYLVNCPESEWQEMRAEGQSFLASESATVFSVSAFAETAMEILHKL